MDETTDSPSPEGDHLDPCANKSTHEVPWNSSHWVHLQNLKSIERLDINVAKRAVMHEVKARLFHRPKRWDGNQCRGGDPNRGKGGVLHGSDMVRPGRAVEQSSSRAVEDVSKSRSRPELIWNTTLHSAATLECRV